MIRSRLMILLAIAAATLLALGGPAAAQDGPTVSVEPSTGLSDGDTVTVTASGFPADSEVFASGQCVTPLEDFLAQCDVSNIVPVPLDSSGGATIEVVVHEGPIGTGTCGEGADQCVIAVGSLTEPEGGAAPIFFGSDGPDAGADQDLANTGPRSIPLILVIAFMALAIGFILTSISRRHLSS